ncbi:GNAT family N-acetyltransferase [Mucilaginibacter sp. McL0603]|uniref:GNAT family N-acetyltransferase n=1 Tax=Mucilaginibacter sp. McL0603 TaxID=3415670 RepID=UPI003CEBDDE3
MERVTVRTATLDDLDTLLGFEKGIMTTERPFDPTIQEGDVHYYDIAHMITAANVEVAVAESGGEIIGSGYVRIEDSKAFLKHKKHGFLGFMYVKPEDRGKGVNQKVIEALQQWAISRGVNEFRLEVYDRNSPAIKAYEKLGFTKLLIEMRMEVPAGKSK